MQTWQAKERTTEEGLQMEFSQWLTNLSLKVATTVQAEGRLQEHREASPSATVVWQEVGQVVNWQGHDANGCSITQLALYKLSLNPT